MVLTDQQSKKAVADTAGVSTRTVELWIASYKERHTTPDAKPAMEDAKPQVTTEVNPNA